MSNRVIICEASEIITAGLYEIIQGMDGFDVVARLDTPECLSSTTHQGVSAIHNHRFGNCLHRASRIEIIQRRYRNQ